MRSVNEVTLIGNLTRDPEMRTTQNGQVITTFGMATNRQWTTQTGDKQSSAEFHEITVWSKLAEICAQYLKKGKFIYIKGYLKTRVLDGEDGTRRYRTEVVATDMIMLDKKEGSDEYTASESNKSINNETSADNTMSETVIDSTASEPASTAESKDDIDQADDDMPF